MEIIVLMLVVLSVLGAVGLALVYCGCLVSPAQRRQAAVQAETALAEARLDLLTRQTLQQMRDAARSELRRRDDDRA